MMAAKAHPVLIINQTEQIPIDLRGPQAVLSAVLRAHNRFLFIVPVKNIIILYCQRPSEVGVSF